jgi:thiamine kinase-like enzyme
LIKQYIVKSVEDESRGKRDWLALRTLQGTGFVPELLWPEELDEVSGHVVVTRFVPGIPADKSDVSKRALENLGKALAVLHHNTSEKLEPRTREILLPLKDLDLHYRDIVLNLMETPEFERCRELWPQQTLFAEKHAREALRGHSRIGRCPKSLIHGDLVLENVLVGTSGEIWLVDWEYSTLGPRMADIAYLLALNPELTPRQTRFIRNGYGSKWNDGEIRKWQPLVASLGLVWYLNQASKETSVDEKGSKGLVSMNIANFQKIAMSIEPSKALGGQ